MGIKKTLGGDRVGAGKQMTVELDGFGRSSHNVGFIFTTDQACGTLVPYWCDLGKRGDTFYIDMTVQTRTLPTVGPIFGSFKHQIDVYAIPLRLYIAALHNNALGIGLHMEKVFLPIMNMVTRKTLDYSLPDINSQQISQDSLAAYIGIRGLGKTKDNSNFISRSFPAMFLLAYWDIYKNYYANKQEEIGYVITPGLINYYAVTVSTSKTDGNVTARAINGKWDTTEEIGMGYTLFFTLGKGNLTQEEAENFVRENGVILYDTVTNAAVNWSSVVNEGTIETKLSVGRYIVSVEFKNGTSQPLQTKANAEAYGYDNTNISMTDFPLENIDNMREEILKAPKTLPFVLNRTKTELNELLPYSATIGEMADGNNASFFSQTGLGIKTYLSDRFNNWLSTEWIDGVNGINEITAVDVSDGKLSMDALILSKKVFRMMNRVAVSGGSYNDWQEATTGVRSFQIPESPMYMGGMSSEIAFSEVVSNSATEDEPLGSLAGRGKDFAKKGGSSIKVKCNEITMIMAIGSITPRISYSQGNKWWNRLQTMNDFHKPDLDAIGFQELLTEEFAAFDTEYDGDTAETTYKSVGLQTSWIEYMTNVSQSFGSFAANGNLSFMCMNRTYHHDAETGEITDATTYIDPTIYNVAFADAKLSAKNFWINVAFDITARRVMSAKQIPNL